MSTMLFDEIEDLRQSVSLTGADLARVTGAADSTVRAWFAGSRSPGREREERLIELLSIVERLGALMDPGYIPLWLRKPNVSLNDEKPIDVIAAGKYKQVSRIIAGLESPPAT